MNKSHEKYRRESRGPANAIRMRRIHTVAIILAHLAALGLTATVATALIDPRYPYDNFTVVIGLGIYPAFVTGELSLIAAWIVWGRGYFLGRMAIGGIAAMLLYASAALVNSHYVWMDYLRHPSLAVPDPHLIQFYCFYWHEAALWYWTTGLFMMLTVSCFWLLRLMGVQWLAPIALAEEPPRQGSRRQFGIRDLFLLTFILAVGLAVGLRVFGVIYASHTPWMFWAAVLAIAVVASVVVVPLNSLPVRLQGLAALVWLGMAAAIWTVLLSLFPSGHDGEFYMLLIVVIMMTVHGLPITLTLWTLRGLGYRAVWRPSQANLEEDGA